MITIKDLQIQKTEKQKRNPTVAITTIPKVRKFYLRIRREGIYVVNRLKNEETLIFEAQLNELDNVKGGLIHWWNKDELNIALLQTN